MEFAISLVQSRGIPLEMFFEALVRRAKERTPLGQIALETGKLSPRQLRELLHLQSDQHKRLGELAIERGFIDRRDLAEMLLVQEERMRPVVDHLIELGAISREQALLAEEAYKSSFHSMRNSPGAHVESLSYAADKTIDSLVAAF